MFYFFRSQKEFPRNWTEVKFEMLNIWCGLVSTNEDILSRSSNRIGEFIISVCELETN